MKELKDKIEREGVVAQGDILQVDSFLNHQVDIVLLDKIANRFVELFADTKPTKILTVEASGLPFATAVGLKMGLPVLFAKKTRSHNLDKDVYVREVFSYTRGETIEIQVSKKYLHTDERVLVIDDFLARGKALLGLIEIVRQSGAYLCGCGIVVEKGFQNGGKTLRDMGVNLKSLAIVDSMSEGEINFR